MKDSEVTFENENFNFKVWKIKGPKLGYWKKRWGLLRKDGAVRITPNISFVISKNGCWGIGIGWITAYFELIRVTHKAVIRRISNKNWEYASEGLGVSCQTKNEEG